MDRRRGAGQKTGHRTGRHPVPKDGFVPSDVGFGGMGGWVTKARFDPVDTSQIAEGTPLHVFLLLRLPATPVAASVARHAVAGIRPYLNPAVADNAELLVSELVTNSVRHAGLPEEASIEFSVRASSEVLMVEVADGGLGFDSNGAPRPRVVSGVAEPSGWGLFLVDRISDRWGAVQMDGETRVWFELRPGAKALAG
jgi:anti-sigma regulatory factor (Ser/Thr protein kinase)